MIILYINILIYLMLHALLHKEHIIGLYSNLSQCKLMLKGLVQNNFTQLELLSIVSYHTNSIVIGTMDSDNNIIENFTDETTTTTPIKTKEEIFIVTDELTSSTKNKIKKQRDKKSKIEYNMSLLKQQKEKLEESKNIYKNDYELFKKFKKIIKDTPTFEIPELFKNKFNIMIELEKLNNLSFETFIDNYKKEQILTEHGMMFANENNNKKTLLEISSNEE